MVYKDREGNVWEGLGALTFHTSQCRSHRGDNLPLEPRSKSWQNLLTAGSHFEEGEVEHDLIKRENCVNDFKISLGIGSTTWFSLRWCQNLRQSLKFTKGWKLALEAGMIHVFLISHKISSPQQLLELGLTFV